MSDLSELVVRMRNAGMVTTPFYTASILNYEAGYVARNARYFTMERDEQMKAGYKAYLQTELADLIMQARVLTDICGFSYSDLEKMGETRLLERMKDFADQGIKPTDTA